MNFGFINYLGFGLFLLFFLLPTVLFFVATAIWMEPANRSYFGPVLNFPPINDGFFSWLFCSYVNVTGICIHLAFTGYFGGFICSNLIPSTAG